MKLHKQASHGSTSAGQKQVRIVYLKEKFSTTAQSELRLIKLSLGAREKEERHLPVVLLRSHV